jgi:hypothetical protein
MPVLTLGRTSDPLLMSLPCLLWMTYYYGDYWSYSIGGPIQNEYRHA